ncbi:hypothetical protein KASHIRA_01510 [Serratia phage vB_SmaM-Kashira]|nr:hypothetical protein [Acinetobacter phage ABPH49]URC22725.1 hypothetical protein KASHIRA_01510 [Serratia phage vB_SmaM-Kashira]
MQKVKVVLCAKCLKVYRIKDPKDCCPGCKKQIFYSNYTTEEVDDVKGS